MVGEWITPNSTTNDFGAVLANREAVCGNNTLCLSFLDTHGATAAAGLSAGLTPEELCIAVTLCPVNGTCILFKTWPVTPLGPWPSPKPFPSAIPLAADGVAASETDPEDPTTLLTLRMKKLMTLLAYLDASNRLEQEAGETETNTGLYGLAKSVLRTAVTGQVKSGLGDPCGLNITCIINRVFDQHLPLSDADGDNFASSGTSIFEESFRGANWRGRDCNDLDATVYPGREQTTLGPEVDHNCNGIYGVDTDGVSFEQKFCAGTKQRGIAILGDSAAAHFHIPASWLSGRDWNLVDLLPAASDELDWPQCSWSTGFANTTDCPPAALPVNSMYQRLRARNLCMHRDFQNIGVNGGRTLNMNPPGIINALQRNPKVDQPLLVFFALIGNDVCNGHPGTSHMTTPAEFLAAVTSSLQYLDTVLPAGSTVVFIGLVDGRVLWNTMHDKIHPAGVPYPDVYDWLSCNGNNPCWGWLNSNETWRNITTQRAQQLNAVYANITASQKYQNFDMYFHNPDWMSFISQYAAAGGLASDLIEPIDGFHPSQTGNMYLASSVFEYLEQTIPEVLGPINPNNAAILAKFGDQGGYN